MSTSIKIKGHSGCSLNVFEDEEGKLRVKKSCKESYVPRLQKQWEKQVDAELFKQGKAFGNNIIVPSANWEDDSIVMDYVHADSFIEYFETASADSIESLAKLLISYVNAELNCSSTQSVSPWVFWNKIDSVLKACTENELVDNAKAARYCTLAKASVAMFDEIRLPIGKCHGDLTFSNILFTGDKVCLIDFLDSFIETPLQDIVKLRQDTAYAWSTLMADASYNKAHIGIVLKYLDSRIDEYYSEYAEFYNKYYNMLQYINILRILPYVKEQKTYEYVCGILDSIDLGVTIKTSKTEE